jgi:hypothetical protein
MTIHSRPCLMILAGLAFALVLVGCNRAGANQNVTDWEICLDAPGAYAIDAWLTEQQIETHDLRAQVYRSIPASTWLQSTPRLIEGAVPETVVSGTVRTGPIPTDLAMDRFPRPALLLLRDRDSGNELYRRPLSPGYNSFKTFCDASGIAEAGILSRGNLLLLAPLDWSRGRHQAVTIAVTAATATPAAAPTPAPAPVPAPAR